MDWLLLESAALSNCGSILPGTGIDARSRPPDAIFELLGAVRKRRWTVRSAVEGPSARPGPKFRPRVSRTFRTFGTLRHQNLGLNFSRRQPKIPKFSPLFPPPSCQRN